MVGFVIGSPGPFLTFSAGPRGSAVTFTRLWADRRSGTDRRSAPRRQSVMVMSEERRSLVDRRRGSERRGTPARRGRALRGPEAGRAVEHVRDALHLLR